MKSEKQVHLCPNQDVANGVKFLMIENNPQYYSTYHLDNLKKNYKKI